MQRPAGRARAVAAAVALATVLVVAGAVLVTGGWFGDGDGDGDETSSPPPPPPAAPTTTDPAPEPSGTPSPGAQRVSAECGTVSRPFAPRTVTVPGVVRNAQVLTPPRDANGVPGVPPLDEGGKSVFAWDREQRVRPGDPAGNVLLNAHTWPDGSALGNRLLENLGRGDRIVLHGARSRLCYRVTERVEVPGDQPMHRYFAQDGPPQVAIVVCSGRRLGPGLWEKRTVWFASPEG